MGGGREEERERGRQVTGYGRKGGGKRGGGGGGGDCNAACDWLISFSLHPVLRMKSEPDDDAKDS